MAVVAGGEGADVLGGTGAIDQVNGQGGDDRLSGGDGSDRLDGGDGNDVVYGWGAADERADVGSIAAVRVASGLALPVFAVSPPGDPDRLFVLEKDAGRVQVLDLASGRVSPFLDIPDAEFSRGGERGALGLAFHPDYASNGRFFVYLTTPAGDLQIREYGRGPDGMADASGGRTIITVPHRDFANHNGGWIAFGPDGMLYAATGDGGGGGDPRNNAQNPDSLLGKILRLDVNGDAFPDDAGRNYAFPAGNPFVGRDGADEVWHLGLRNPFRASFDPLTGDLYIADVGEVAREEVNFVAAGQGGRNFGWRIREGLQTYRSDQPAGPGPLVDPILDYGRAPGPFGGTSVTGGLVNRGPGGAQGLYVFGDFISSNLWTVRVEDGVAQDFLNRNGQVRTDAGTLNLPAAFVQDGRGRVYVVGLDGEIHRLDFAESAGDGGDLLVGGAGDDRLFGGAGDDRIGGQDGDDFVDGGPGRDDLFGDAGADLIVGGEGDDRLHGQDGDDRMGGKAGNDYLEGGGGRDDLFGDEGADLIVGGVENDRLHGQDGDDRIGGQEGDDYVEGLAGRDDLFGDDGQDLITGGVGDDRLHGQGGDDILLGGDGGDYLEGGDGDDRLEGGLGDDLLLGGAGLDTAVFDLVSGGSDRIDLGEGADEVLVSAGGRIRQVRVTFDGAAVGDGGGGLVVSLQGEDLQPDSLVGPISLADDEGITFVAGGDLVFDVRDGGSRGERFAAVQLGTAAGETLDGTSGQVRAAVVPFEPLYLNGGGGNDRLVGGTADDVLVGGRGDDQAGGGQANDLMQGGDGDDFMGGEQGNDRLEGGAGVDVLFGDAGDDELAGGSGDDRAFGGDGNDTLRGEDGSDYLDGNVGNDVLEGGGGFDELRGGAGADRFVFAFLTDAPPVTVTRLESVVDFDQRAGDRIDLSRIDADPAAEGDQAFVVVGAFSGRRGEVLLLAAGDNTQVSLDVDGDRLADFTVLVTGAVNADGLIL